jgi:hypothetical protein
MISGDHHLCDILHGTANMIGKRKRAAVVVRRISRSDELEETNGGHDVLRKHFESMFEPISHIEFRPDPTPDEEDSAEDSSDTLSDWSGLSDDDDEDQHKPVVQVVEHTIQSDYQPAEKPHAGGEFKSFMVCEQRLFGVSASTVA